MTPARLLPRLMTLLIALVLSTALLPAAPANAEATRAQLTKKVKRLLYETALPDFTLIKRKAERNNDRNALEWEDNGCSTPVPSPFNGRFNAACERHDFGYRNLGNGVGASPSRAFDSTESAKKKVDLQLKEDLLYSCRSYPGPNGDCNDAANTYYFFVSRAGKSWTSFYDRECTPGWFCLFDDSGYGDRRKRFSVSHDNMDDFDFGDKASSVKNRTKVAWIIYDDSGYDDRNYCIPAGGSVKSLKDKWNFNDKTSSIERLSGARCP